MHNHLILTLQTYSVATAILLTTRGHNYKLFKPQAASRVRSIFFTVWAISDWNSLPDHMVNSPTLSDFKILLTVAGLH